LAIERLNLATGRREPLSAPDGRVISSAEWNGLRLEQHLNPPAEWPEGHTLHDSVAVLLSESCIGESWWPGVPQRKRQFCTGSVFVTPARMPFRHRSFAATESFHVEISPEFLPGDGRHPVELRPVFGEEDPLVASLLLGLSAELRTAGGIDRLYAESLAAALAAHLAKRYARRSAAGTAHHGGLATRKLRTIQEYVESHLEHDLGLGRLAALVQMNVDSFLRAFRQRTGTTPHKYVLRQRILRAQALLRVPAIAIGEVSARCGFRAQASFTRAFHRITGTTPRSYRSLL
jgi:AraC family transcriptional regulator